MSQLTEYFKSSIGKKQIVALTGLLLVVYVLGHLAGNLLIFLGPDWYNSYAGHLTGLRPGLYVVEFGLLAVFIIHIYVTALIVLENIKARGQHYAVYKAVGERSLATRIMPYTGTFLLFFVIWHLLDFTFVAHEGPRSMVRGEDLGLYGLVYNTFSDPLHSALYVVAMFCLGFHLAHGIQSFIQTLGSTRFSNHPLIRSLSSWVGLLIAVAYSSIPVYVYLDNIAKRIP